MKNTKTIKGMKKGFTLVELLFVMAIISILAGIGISQMSGSTDAALKTAAKADVRTLVSAQVLYFTNEDEYATSISDLEFSSSNESLSQNTEGFTSTFCVDSGTEEWAYKYHFNDGKITEGRCDTGGFSVI